MLRVARTIAFLICTAVLVVPVRGGLAQADQLIVPGERIGPYRLGTSLADLQALMGAPTQRSQPANPALATYAWVSRGPCRARGGPRCFPSAPQRDLRTSCEADYHTGSPRPPATRCRASCGMGAGCADLALPMTIRLKIQVSANDRDLMWMRGPPHSKPSATIPSGAYGASASIVRP